MEYIETRGLRIYLNEEVYKPKEDTFMVVDTLRDLEEINGELLEVGSGSGFVILSLIDDLRKPHYATDINYKAAKQTLLNAKKNRDDNLQVICGDLTTAFRKKSLPDTILFNPPYLPEDPDVDPHSPKHELQQLVGGKEGYEEASRLLELVNNQTNVIYLIISSLATNPVEFDQIHKDWNIRVLRSKNVGFETIWLLKVE